MLQAIHFRRYGRTCQLVIENADQLEQILTLDESLWMATSAPASAYRCDQRFLALVDTNGDQRIQSDELKDAVRWLLGRLADSTHLGEGLDRLTLTAIRSDSAAGRALLESARYVLASLDSPDAEVISLAQVQAFAATMKARPLNGDGIVVPEATEDPALRAYIADVIAVTGGVDDASGRKGVTQELVTQFQGEIQPFLAWRRLGDPEAGDVSAPQLPFGPDTPALYELVQRHADRVMLFFALCRLVRFDPRSADRTLGSGAELDALDPAGRGEVEAYLQGLPIAVPEAGGRLPLSASAVNPLYGTWAEALRSRIVARVLGSDCDVLTEDDWARIVVAFVPYKAYLEAKPGGLVGALPVAKLEAYGDANFAEQIGALLRADAQVGTLLGGIVEVERLLLYHRYLMRLANNFVSFPQLYSPDQRALFETGSVVMDGRWFNLAVGVDNPAAHSAVAKASNLFVMYMEITRAGGSSFSVVVPTTAGTKGNLGVGKRGVFFDIEGRECDARVIQVIENPVSLREALAVPFVRLWRLAEGKIESWSGSAEKGLRTEFDKSVALSGTSPGAKPAAPERTGVAGGSGSMLIGFGVAAAALGSAFAFVTKTLASLRPQQIAGGLLGAVLLVMLPVSLIAFLKLRRQDLSALLEGCGWAINARMRLTRTQRRHFTRVPGYPLNAVGTPRTQWLRIVLAVVGGILVFWGALQLGRALF